MPIALPNLDDRRYDDLYAEARALIPTYAPEWTNHNPSDPGITLIELFAYLTELLIYRLNRVTEAETLVFLKLLNAPGWQPAPGRGVSELIRETVRTLREPYRAITCADFESLVRRAFPERVALARCVARRNLEPLDEAEREEDAPGRVSLIVVPFPAAGENSPRPDAALLSEVEQFLDPRRLVTTIVHVVGPRYVPVGVRLTVVLLPDALELDEAEIVGRLKAALRNFFHPLTGGPGGAGWPFGRNVFVSEVYELLDVQPLVDYVEQTGQQAELRVGAGLGDRLLRNAEGGLIGVALKPDELVNLSDDLIELTIRKT